MLADKASIKALSKYLHYADVFLFELAIELPKNTNIDEHAMELVEGKQLSFGLFYSPGPVELETLKAYIKLYLKIGFIQPFKSFADAFIFFNQKPDRSLYLCVNY